MNPVVPKVFTKMVSTQTIPSDLAIPEIRSKVEGGIQTEAIPKPKNRVSLGFGTENISIPKNKVSIGFGTDPIPRP